MYKRRVKKKTLLALTTIFLIPGFFAPGLFTPGLYAIPESRVILGEKSGFSGLATVQGLETGIGPDASPRLFLRDLQLPAGADTDLYLSFDQEPLRDLAANYKVRVMGSPVPASPGQKMRGPASGAFQRDSRLVLTPRAGRNALFGPGSAWGDFTIQFWLYPATLENGETILAWRGADFSGAETRGQDFSCSIEGKTLVWRSSNLFQAPGLSGGTIELKGSSPLLPRTWRHHSLRFEAATGLLEYAVDGIPEDIRYAGPTGREGGRFFQPRIGGEGRTGLEIGQGFTGFMDELRIDRTAAEVPEPSAFSAAGGGAETLPVDLGYGGSALLRIDARYTTPSNSGIFFFYQISEDPAGFTGMEWTPFVPGKDLAPDATGRFVRFRIEMFPDGRRSVSPRLFELSITFEKNLPPPPPAFFAAFPGDSSIKLRWSEVTDPNLQGYLIYYGSGPGVYDGSELGPSPLHVGKITETRLRGLRNGKLYYFAVSSYDGRGDYRSGLLSREVSARPSRLHRNDDDDNKD